MNAALTSFLFDVAARLAPLGALWLVQSTLLVGAGLLIAQGCRRYGPALESVVLRATLLAALLCPVLSLFLGRFGIEGRRLTLPGVDTIAPVAEVPAVAGTMNPSPAVPFRPSTTVASRSPMPAADSPVKIESSGAQPVAPRAEPSARREAQPALRAGTLYALATAAWVAGGLFMLLRLALCHGRIARLRQESDLAAVAVFENCSAIARELAIAPPEVRVHMGIKSPLLVGLVRPAILLPDVKGLEDLVATREVLVHELAHAVRGDCFWHLLSRVATALLWIQPFLWLLARRIEETAEDVCDNYVIEHARDRRAYASTLVALAEQLQFSPTESLAGTGVIAFRSALGHRVVRILDASRNLSRCAGGRAFAGTTALVALAMGAVSLVGIAGAEAQTVATAKPVTPMPGATVKTIISSTNRDAHGSLSPDEATLAFEVPADPDGGKYDIGLRDLRSGETKTVAADPGRKGFGFPGGSFVWSHDSKLIAYDYDWSADDSWENSQSSLRILSREGGEPKTIFSRSDEDFTADDWSPDGKTLVGTWRQSTQPDKPAMLALINAATGELHPIGPDMKHTRFSPDGKFIVGERTENGNRDVFIVSVDGTQTTRVTNEPMEDGTPAFSTDGRFVVFSSNRRGTWDLWAVAVNGGHPAGAEFLVKYDFGDHAKWPTTTGKMAFRIKSTGSDVYEVPASDVAASGDTGAKQLTQAYAGRNFSPVWSPDGKKIAYLRNAGAANSHNALCVQSTTGGEERVFDPGLARCNRMFWSPDSESIGIFGVVEGRSGGWGLYVFSLTSGQRVVDHLQTSNNEGWPLGFTGKGKEFIFLDIKSKERVAVDLATRAQRTISSPAEQAWLAKAADYDFSSDAAPATYVQKVDGEQQLVVVEADQRAPRVIARTTKSASIMCPRWSPDHTKVAYYATHVINGMGRHELRLCAADGSWDRHVDTGGRFIGNATLPPSWSPDGSKLVLTLVQETVGEIGVLENFLPADNAHQVVDGSAGATGVSSLALRRVEQVKFPGSWGATHVSPDGRYFIYGGDADQAMLVNVETQSVQKLAKAKLGACFSGDSTQVALLNGDPEHGAELSVLNLDGSVARVVAKFTSETLDYAWLHSWSPDGREFAVVTRKGKTNNVALVDAGTGSVRVLHSTGGNEPDHLVFSPDGRWLGYDVGVDVKGINSDVFAIEISTGRQSALVQHQADDHLMGWSPRSNAILFTSNRRGNFDAWLVACAAGKPSGEPVLVKSDLGESEPIGVTKNGAFYFTQREWVQDVFTAAIDPATGRPNGEPKKAIGQFEGTNSAASWSPDGRRLAYSSRRPPFVIRVLDTETQEDQVVAEGLYGPKWSPDGKSLLCYSQWDVEEHKLYLVDLATRRRTLVDDGKPDGSLFRAYQWAPEGGAIYYQYESNPKPAASVIVRRELAAGKETEIQHITGGGAYFAVSPDGRSMVFKNERSLYLAPAGGGEATLLLKIPKDHYIPGWDMFTWSADGRAIIVGVWQVMHQAEQMQDSIKSELLRVPIDGGPSVVITNMARVRYPHANPDGTRITFSAGTPRLELWVMENFLPAEQLAAK
jgi:Tol biopolymer transport system component/beta-lactamase regulating signal transducer with metallopeptidase domain